MKRWYESDKLLATGFVKGRTDSTYLSHYCSNFELAEGDRIIYSRIDAGPDGVVGLAFQSVQVPEWSIFGDSARYSYVNQNWKRWGDDGDAFAGFWGTSLNTGDLGSLGFVVEDTVCTAPFKSALGSSYNWTSPYGDIAVQPVRSAEHVEQY